MRPSNQPAVCLASTRFFVGLPAAAWKDQQAALLDGSKLAMSGATWSSTCQLTVRKCSAFVPVRGNLDA